MEEYENNNVINDVKSNNQYLVKVFLWMFMGLFATGIVSVVTYSTDFLIELIFTNGLSLILIAELVVVILFSLFFRKVSPFVASVLYFLYAIINGITLASIFYLFELSSIMFIFFATAAFFGILALIGYKTDKDLSSIGTIALVALSVAIVVSIINLFIGATMVDIVLDWIILGIFAILTMYDMQKIKIYQTQMPEKGYIYGAMDLYLDFINIFLRLLRLFGKRRD